MRYRDAVAEAKRLVRRSEEDQWRLAELTWEQVNEGGHSMQSWADDIKVSKAHAVFLTKVWEAYSGYPVTDRPKFADAYAEAKGMPVERQERREAEAMSNIRKASPAVKARLASELLEDDEVAEEVEELRIAKRGPSEPLPEPEVSGRNVGNRMARAMDTDLATAALRAAISSVAEAILTKEEFGIKHQAEYDAELERLNAMVSRLVHGDTFTDADRAAFAEMGVEL